MNRVDVVRAWRDADYRATLTPAQRSTLPGHPAGPIELDDEQLYLAASGALRPDTCGGCASVWSRRPCCCL
jgi:mersacidin/lichenicidin family type 2 lantibiotic